MGKHQQQQAHAAWNENGLDMSAEIVTRHESPTIVLRHRTGLSVEILCLAYGRDSMTLDITSKSGDSVPVKAIAFNHVAKVISDVGGHPRFAAKLDEAKPGCRFITVQVGEEQSVANADLPQSDPPPSSFPRPGCHFEKCSTCGSLRIQALDWIDPGTLEVIGGNEGATGSHLWCEACDDHPAGFEDVHGATYQEMFPRPAVEPSSHPSQTVVDMADREADEAAS